MEQLISLLIVVVIFAVELTVLGGSAQSAPQPVFWIVGLILLIFIPYFLAGQFGDGHSFKWR